MKSFFFLKKKSNAYKLTVDPFTITARLQISTIQDGSLHIFTMYVENNGDVSRNLFVPWRVLDKVLYRSIWNENSVVSVKGSIEFEIWKSLLFYSNLCARVLVKHQKFILLWQKYSLSEG